MAAGKKKSNRSLLKEIFMSFSAFFALNTKNGSMSGLFKVDLFVSL